MNPNLYMKKWCFTKHPLKNGCLGFQVDTCFNHDIMMLSAEAAGSARMQSNCSGEKLLTAKLLVFFVAFISWFPWLTVQKMLNKFSFFFGDVQLSRTGEVRNHIWFSFFGGGVRNANQTTCSCRVATPKKKCGSLAGRKPTSRRWVWDPLSD